VNVPPPHDWHAPIIAAVADAYSRFRPVVYVEIGVDRGHTMRTVSRNAVECHAVDVTFEHVNGPLGPNVHRWEMTSDEFFGRGLDGMSRPADVVFVDGDHSREAVTRDIAGALSILAEDGVVIVHDTFPLERRWAKSHCGYGCRAVEALDGSLAVRCATLPIFPGLSFITLRLPAISEEIAA
jgi:hypothetical protein